MEINTHLNALNVIKECICIKERREKLVEVVKSKTDKPNGLVRRLSNGKYLGIKCHLYNPCPICYRCTNYFPQKYQACRDCSLISCNHTTKQKNLLIKRT